MKHSRITTFLENHRKLRRHRRIQKMSSSNPTYSGMLQFIYFYYYLKVEFAKKEWGV